MLGTCLTAILVASLNAFGPEPTILPPEIALVESAGFVLRIPDGWTARRDGSIVILSSTRDAQAIVIDVQLAEPADDAALRSQLARARPAAARGAIVRIGGDALARSSKVSAAGEPMHMRIVARRLDATHIAILRGAAMDEDGASFDDVVDRFAASIVVRRPDPRAGAVVVVQ